MPINVSSAYLKTAGSDKLGRYYTQDRVGAFLVEQMTGPEPAAVLDLGAGGGSLSLAAMMRWSEAELITVDIDACSRTKLRERFGNVVVRHSHIRADALRIDLPRLVSSSIKSIDAAVCNPPFIIPKWRTEFSHIIEEAGFSSSISALPDVDAALLFLAQNIRLMSKGGALGIVLPDSLVSSVKYRPFRRDLLARFDVEKAVRLPRNSFAKTDAQAHILVIRKDTRSTRVVALQEINENFEARELMVGVEQAEDRLDFSYHAQGVAFSSIYSARTRKLEDVAQVLTRGRFTSAEVKSSSYPVFHTTNITDELCGHWCDISSFGKTPPASGIHSAIAEPGDILVARVGRNLERKVIGIAKGYARLSDCVYKVRVAEADREALLERLGSEGGRAWLASQAYGVSAKQLTKLSLLAFPF